MDEEKKLTESEEQKTLFGKIRNITENEKFKKGSRYFYMLIAFILYTAFGAWVSLVNSTEISQFLSK